MLTLEVRKGEGMLEAINNKELKLIEVLSIAMNLFIRNFRMVMVVVAFLFFPISILNVLIMSELTNSASFLLGFSEAGDVLENISLYSEVIYHYFTNTLLQLSTVLFLEPIGVIAIAKITKSKLYEEEINLKETLGEAINCIWNVVITGIPYGIMIIIAFSALILPGFYFMAIWAFYVYAIAFRGMNGWNALVYSKKLTEGKFWKTCGFVLMIRLLIEGWNLLFSSLFLFAPQHIGTDILYNILTYIAASFSYMAMTVLFMNREAVLLGIKHDPTENVIVNALNGEDN